MIHELKIKFDKLFDDVFFSKNFKEFIVSKTGYCPNGLTIDTDVNDDVPEFTCLCKEYGYDYANDRIIGDYRILKTPTNMETLSDLMLEYLKENNNDLFNEVLKYDIYF